MWTFCLVLLVCSHLRDFGVDAAIDENAIDNLLINTTTNQDTPKDCVSVVSGTGNFAFKTTTNSSDVCGIYFVTDSRNLIEITFTEFDVPCDKNGKGEGGLVQYIDGWELQKQVFPSAHELSTYSAEDNEFCSDNKPLNKKFISSQNGAQISYRIPHIGKGFAISVEHKKHPSPCNIIDFGEPYYLLENHGKKKNCSIFTPYEAAIQFNSYNVGESRSEPSNSAQCAQAEDHIEIGGGSLDTNHVEILDTICGKSEADGSHEDLIKCKATTVKLVSSGTYNNKVNISMRPIVGEDMKDPKYSCTSSSLY